jgi:hypothetical protein
VSVFLFQFFGFLFLLLSVYGRLLSFICCSCVFSLFPAGGTRLGERGLGMVGGLAEEAAKSGQRPLLLVVLDWRGAGG